MIAKLSPRGPGLRGPAVPRRLYRGYTEAVGKWLVWEMMMILVTYAAVVIGNEGAARGQHVIR